MAGVAAGVWNQLPKDPKDDPAPLPQGPRSGSSAMPDPNSPNVPRLQARVHQHLSAADSAQIPLSALRFRPLEERDFEEMVALHTEWFPVSYDDGFYQKSVQGELFSLVATHSTVWAEGGSTGAGEENLLGIITMSTFCEHHGEDIQHVLGDSCSALCSRCRSECNEGNEEEGTGRMGGGSLAYILTLGVADGFRRRGLAKELLRRSIDHVNSNMPKVQAVYLHVVTYNAAAIQLYESMRFARLSHFPSFYLLHGSYYDSYLYALYIHDGRPPWKWRLRNFLGLRGNGSWTEWVLSTWSSLWKSKA